MELLGALHNTNRLEAVAHHAGPTEAAWNGLDFVYRERAYLLAELVTLENCGAADLVRFFSASEEERADQIGHALLASGVTNWERKFVNIDY
jgi:hypothetical protein